MAYTVAITNQKGGVGKTTTAVNLAAALAIAERRTLLVDADPQGNTTSGVGIAKLELQVSLYDVLVDGHPVHDVIQPVPGLRHLSLLPATQDLVGAELQLVERPFRESALRRVLEPLEGEYDYIVVDCPPSLGLLTLNVLAAVQQLIIPIQCEYYGLEGISQLLNTVRLVQQNINPGLAIGGVLLTMYDSRLNLCRQVAEDATEYFGPKVFGTPIPRNVRLAEAPSFGKPILLYDVQSVGAKSYLAVAQELLRRVEGTDVTIGPAEISAATAQVAASTQTETQEVQENESEHSEPATSSDHRAPAPAAEVREVMTQETVVEQTMEETAVPEPGAAEMTAPEPAVPEAAEPEAAAGEAIVSEPGEVVTEAEPPVSISSESPPANEQEPLAAAPEITADHGDTNAMESADEPGESAPRGEDQEPIGAVSQVVAIHETHAPEATAAEADRSTDASEPRPEVTT